MDTGESGLDLKMTQVGYHWERMCLKVSYHVFYCHKNMKKTVSKSLKLDVWSYFILSKSAILRACLSDTFSERKTHLF